MNNAIPLFVIIPLFTAFLIPMIGKVFTGFYKVITPTIFLFLTCLSIYFLLNPLHGGWQYKVGGWSEMQEIPVAIYLIIDALSSFLLVIINLIAFAASFYAVSYINRYEGKTNFFILFCLMSAGMNGVVIAGDIFNMFVFLEISVISSYALVAFGIEKVE